MPVLTKNASDNIPANTTTVHVRIIDDPGGAPVRKANVKLSLEPDKRVVVDSPGTPSGRLFVNVQGGQVINTGPGTVQVDYT